MTATIFLYALCCAISWVTALFAWRRRAQPGLTRLTGVMISVAVWGSMTVLEMSARELSVKLVFTAIANFSIASAGILMLFFVLELCRLDNWLTPLRRAIIWLPVFIYLGLTISNPWHHWIWTGFRPGQPGSNITLFNHGPVYYGSVVYQFILAAGAFIVLGREIAASSGAERRRTTWIMASTIIALLPYIVYLIWPEINLGFDLMPVGLTLSALLISWTVFEDLDRQMHARTLELGQSVQRLEHEIAERERVEAELHDVQDSLALRVVEQSRNLSGIYELVLLAGASDDLPRLLDESLKRICTVLSADAACIHRRDAGATALPLIAQYNLTPEQQVKAARLPDGWLAPHDVPRALPNLLEPDGDQASSTPAALQFQGMGSAITAPLTRAEEFFGVLTVFWSRPGLASIEHIELFSALAKQVTLLVENIHLRSRIESAAAARERRRLARDLHDSVTQSLHSLTISAFTAGNRLRQGRLDLLDESLHQLSDGAAQALKEMRLLLFEMRLAPLESVDLVEALQTRLEAVEQRAGIDAAMVLESPPLWPKEWEREIYCIAMESLNNSLKHAHAGRVRVRMCVDSDQFLLEVADDGVGFDPSQPARSGMGLRNMAERVERLGGRLSIDAAPGRGACIRVACTI